MPNWNQLTLYRMRPDGFYSDDGSNNPPRPDVLVDLYDYWVGIAGEAEMPDRRVLDPAAIHRLLPHIALVEVAENPTDFIYRLVGDHIVTHAHRNIQGKRLSELASRGNKRDEILQSHLHAIGNAVLETRAPVFADLHYLTVPDAARKLLQCCCLPLAGNGGRMTHIICAADYQQLDHGHLDHGQLDHGEKGAPPEGQDPQGAPRGP